MGKKKRKLKTPTSNKFLYGLIILLVIAGVVLGVITYQDSEEGEFSQFEKQDNVWQAPINLAGGDRVYQFYYHPDNVSNITYDESVNQALRIVQENQGDFGISVDESILTNITNPGLVTVSSFNMARFTAPHFGMGLVVGGTQTDFSQGLNGTLNQSFSESVNFTTVSCEDAGQDLFVVYMNRSNTTSIQRNGYCTTFNIAEDEDLLKLADLFMFKTLGVM